MPYAEFLSSGGFGVSNMTIERTMRRHFTYIQKTKISHKNILKKIIE